ncbi:sigma 54-interacting transcriptional regulator [Marasmitruncus massiliensis]|uniref:sigma 54-interacting transcriptional regulator n=1 Tax=Marasmitruncus massiliensis TaxID=1944642 RepID=UPI000C7CF2A6|nr:sigma 54-interacting transcriptional regulator [Marasmitruncus massiliensis]
MANIAYLLPSMEMEELAQKVIDKMGIRNVTILEYVPSGHAIERGREAVRNGADIIVARGLQASQIKRSNTVPVVEMMMTGQEMGLLVEKGKKMLKKEHPVFGIVGYANMFSNMDYFDEIYGVTIKYYYVWDSYNGIESLKERAREAVNDQVDLIIGGEVAVTQAQESGIPCLFVAATEDSIREGLRVAQRVAYASDLEKANTAELKTLLDNSFGVLVKLDSKGKVVIINHVAESLLGWHPQEVIGRPIAELTDAFDEYALQSVLAEGKEIYSVYICINKVSMVANLSPIKAGVEITGAIFSCQEVKRLEEMGVTARRELYQQGYFAKANFDVLDSSSEMAQSAVAMARLYAQSDAPILICSESGNEQELFAQSIHNAGDRKNGPYVSVGCAQSLGDEQLNTLFGLIDRIQPQNSRKGIISSAHGGTIFLNGVEYLSPSCQYRLLCLLKDGVVISDGEQRPLPVDVRVIACAGNDLPVLVQNGEFSKELFYALNSLYLDIPPLRERPEDILMWVERYMKLFCDRYKRYISLTAGAKKKLQSCMWEGNLNQLSSFFERIVLTAPHRSVDENFIDHLYCQMYPIIRPVKTSAVSVIYKDPEAAVISELLEKYKGSRTDVARELGISTTTLWRKIKKYDIANKYKI